MSEGAAEAAAATAASAEGAAADEAFVALGAHNRDFAFGSLMDVLAPDADGEGAGEGAGEAAPAAGEGGGAAAPGEAGGAAPVPDAGAAGAGGAAGGTAAPGGGDAGAAADAAAGAAGAVPAAGDPGSDGGDGGAGAGRPAAWTQSADVVIPRLGELSTKFEETVTEAFQAEALESLREEHPKYFEAIQKPPQMLVGEKVPALNGSGEEVLRDTAAAREWQEGIKYTLAEELRGRANARLDESKDFLSTVHSSIEIFTKNKDLIPGTKDFNVDLANRFAEFVSDFELRNDEGNLQGYSIPVQPIIDRLRKQGSQSPPAAAAAPGGAGAPPAAAAAAKPPAEAPQAGIPSKAGSSGDSPEDFSTLFGTIHPELRGMRI